jgi:hypothetical protein
MLFHLIRPSSVPVFCLRFGPVLKCNFRAQLKHLKTLVACSVGRFWAGEARENPPIPVGLAWKKNASPPSRFPLAAQGKIELSSLPSMAMGTTRQRSGEAARRLHVQGAEAMAGQHPPPHGRRRPQGHKNRRQACPGAAAGRISARPSSSSLYLISA